MSHKKLHTAIYCVLFALIMCTGGIAAYMISADTALNTFSVGYGDITVTEEYTPEPELEPGSRILKDVRFTNTGKCGCYVRAKAIFTDGDMEKNCSVNFNTEDFTYRQGYYYYIKPLEVGETTESLFTVITINDDIARDKIKDFDVLIYGECYQSEGFDSFETAWTYFMRNGG